MGKPLLEQRITDWECPICRCREYSKIEGYRWKTVLFKNRKLVSCADCSSKSIYPVIPQKDLDKYNENYWVEVQSNDEKSSEIHYLQAESRVKYLGDLLKDLHKFEILEIGAGQGFIFNVLKMKTDHLSYSVVETDKNIYGELRKKGISDIYFSWKEISNCKFDLIILTHVVEHFLEPVQCLNEIRMLLKEGGHIFIEVPNQDDTYKYYIEPHLTVFNRKALGQFVKELGMKIVDIRNIGRSIKDLKKTKNIIQFLKMMARKNFPTVIEIKKIIYSKILGKIAGTDKHINIDDYNLGECNDENGQWLRLLMRYRINSI